MTKKDYIIIADTLRKHRPIHTQDKKVTAQWYLFADIVDEFCRALQNDNEKFNAQKFWETIENEKHAQVAELADSWIVNKRYQIYKNDGVVYDILKAQDIPTYVFEIRERLKKNYPNWI